MKVLLTASILAFLSIAAPAVGINPALLATRLSAEEKKSGYKQELFFKKAQHRRLEDYYYDEELQELAFMSTSCYLTTELTHGLMSQDERFDERFDESFDEDYYYNYNYDMEVYGSLCNSAGGQTLAVTIATSGAECDLPSTFDGFYCLGATCDQEDIEGFEGYASATGMYLHPHEEHLETCISEISAVSDGEGDLSQ
uniref:Subtilisin n=1 Tax=Chaetoceros debilis TaxID=122233 RepID=A0A7S3VBH8_9STRA